MADVLANLEALASRDPERCDVRACDKCGAEMVSLKSARSAPPRTCHSCEVSAALRREGDTRLDDSGCPARYRSFVEPPAWARESDGRPINEFPSAPRQSAWCLTLAGVAGAGKTFLATEIFRRILASGSSGLWFNALDLGRKLDNFAGGEELNDRASKCGVLLIDDLFREGSATERQRIARVLANRYDWQLRTIVTTNAWAKDFEGIDQSIARRIGQSAWVCEFENRWRR